MRQACRSPPRSQVAFLRPANASDLAHRGTTSERAARDGAGRTRAALVSAPQDRERTPGRASGDALPGRDQDVPGRQRPAVPSPLSSPSRPGPLSRRFAQIDARESRRKLNVQILKGRPLHQGRCHLPRTVASARARCRRCCERRATSLVNPRSHSPSNSMEAAVGATGAKRRRPTAHAAGRPTLVPDPPPTGPSATSAR